MGCDQSAPVEPEAPPEPVDPMVALMEAINAQRMTFQQNLPVAMTAGSYFRYMSTTVAKEQSIMQWCMKELHEEMALSAGLEYHIAKQDAKDVFEASDGIGTDEEKMGVVIIGRRPETIAITDTIYKANYSRSLEDQVRGENKTLMGMMGTGTRGASEARRGARPRAKWDARLTLHTRRSKQTARPRQFARLGLGQFARRSL